ncbi:hypothetical protein ABT330_28685 [Streptomyces sp. NPDC000658]|uniref:hypothetical protein n=1 Tax=Streptomyces sp. NPDC000658 TaxID=3154266 RepID=UPI003318629E
MAALTESVAKAKAARGEEADVHEMPKPKKAAAAKKKTAVKQPAKETAKKTSQRRPRSA